MVKEHYTRFDCDNCGEKVIIKDNSGFPYDKGWNYIHKFEGKISTEPTSKIQDSFEKVIFEDSHFCSKDCVLNFMAVKGLNGSLVVEPSSVKPKHVVEEDEFLGDGGLTSESVKAVTSEAKLSRRKGLFSRK